MPSNLCRYCFNKNCTSVVEKKTGYLQFNAKVGSEVLFFWKLGSTYVVGVVHTQNFSKSGHPVKSA